MQVLTKAGDVRAAIREIFQDPTDERIAIVAFVGSDALTFLPEPKDLRLYCWPAPGTNPHAIHRLRRAGVHVDFVERLHAKVFWSRRAGTLIGSANLSMNALGESGLREAVVRLPPGAFDASGFARTLIVVKDFAGKLKWLHAIHTKFQQRNPSLGKNPVKGRRVVLPSLVSGWPAVGAGSRGGLAGTTRSM